MLGRGKVFAIQISQSEDTFMILTAFLVRTQEIIQISQGEDTYLIFTAILVRIQLLVILATFTSYSGPACQSDPALVF